jgi:UDP-N-acetylmuramyl pentapeptide phosphotransferase/UDP-N-acetylglucosamine-1-phosphate transferase
MDTTGLQAAGESMPAGFNAVLTTLFVVWVVNLYNFMDGMDGFAGGMAVIGFGSLAILGWLAGHSSFVVVSAIVASAAGGFLISNFPPARIFMGDVGSSALGLLAAGLLLWGARDGVFPIWVGLLVFSPFIVDATVTLLRRVLRGERVWEAHKTHYYQRLVQLGWGHRKTVLAEYVLMVACAASALWVVNKPPATQYAVILGWICGYAILMVLVGRLEKQRTQQ